MSTTGPKIAAMVAAGSIGLGLVVGAVRTGKRPNTNPPAAPATTKSTCPRNMRQCPAGQCVPPGEACE